MKGCADKVTWQTNSMSSSPYLQNARDSMLARRELCADADPEEWILSWGDCLVESENPSGGRRSGSDLASRS